LTRHNVPNFDNPPVRKTPVNDHVQSDGPTLKDQRVSISGDDLLIIDSRDRSGFNPERSTKLLSDLLEK
jgi:hypothetical protein